MFYAHSFHEKDKSYWQPLREHLVKVSDLAAHYGGKFGASRAAALAGLLHDLGKYTIGFQNRLDGGERVDHATAGAIEVRALAQGGWDAVMAELLAYAIAGHHAGLPDKIRGEASLTERLRKTLEPLDPIWRQEIAPEAGDLLPPLRFDPDNPAKAGFQFSFLGRMVFSCLVDADFRDTEAFYARMEGRVVERGWPALGEVVGDLIAAFDGFMADKQAGAADNIVNRLRRDILDHVRGRAADAPGLFTLTVPTGGGKTLASLGFALDHARRHGLERIVYAIPFTSIIDQTAAVFRTVLGDDMVLEHHAAIDEEANKARESRDKLRLAMEGWAAPVVVTTNVQLFESLFASRPSRCRKLHNLARSIIILDEAQTMPLPLLAPCVAALDELARNYGATVVLCTATQPALDRRDFKAGHGGLALEGRELAPDPSRLARALRRVHIERGGEIGDDDLVVALGRTPQGLVIVNSRKHALDLYRKALDAGLEGVMHLTTRQYAAHRRIILGAVRHMLRDGLPCRLIATSLVEAGVDVDFPRVWRAEAGLDQIAQAAGRCNREGGRPLDDSIVTVFKAPEHPPPREIRQLAEDFARMAAKHDDLLAPDALRDYFGEVYWRKGKALDEKHILDRFTIGGGTNFAYRSVAEDFRMIESGMAPVIVERDEAAKVAVKRLDNPAASPGLVARSVQPYIVQVPPQARAALIAGRHVAFVHEERFGKQFAVLQNPDLYHEETGLLWDDAGYLASENTIF